MQFIKVNYEQAPSGGFFFVGMTFWEGWIGFFVVVFFNMTFSTQCTGLEMGQNLNLNVELIT